MSKEQGGPKGFQMLEEDDAAKGSLPEITFGAFVLSLSTSALMSLGVAPVPGHEGELDVNLPLAHQTIEILAMLEQKTRGNLEEDERHLLESVLHDLRMRYVEASKSAG